MMTHSNIGFVLTQLVSVTTKEAKYLERTAQRLQQLHIDLNWVQSLEKNDAHSEMLDAFVARYGRLQDALGDKLLPTLLQARLEKVGTHLDNLLRAEKLGWIQSIQGWIELRELRNRLIHEYMESPNSLLEALQQALLGVEVLINAHTAMANYVEEMGTP